MLDVIDAANHPLLSAAEEIALCKRILQGDRDARDQLILSNLRLVNKIASKYPSSVLLDHDDLFQEGVQGLMKAVDHFDYTKGHRFSTYATFWIMQAIAHMYAISRHAVHIPYHLDDDFKKVRKAREALTTGGVDPTPEMIAKHTKMKLDLVKDLLLWIGPALSLSLPATGSKSGDTIAYSELLPDQAEDAYAAAEDVADNEMLVTNLLHATTDDEPLLTERERAIIERRYGVGAYAGQDEGDRKQIGAAFAISKQRVLQIEIAGIEKMRKIAG